PFPVGDARAVRVRLDGVLEQAERCHAWHPLRPLEAVPRSRLGRAASTADRRRPADPPVVAADARRRGRAAVLRGDAPGADEALELLLVDGARQPGLERDHLPEVELGEAGVHRDHAELPAGLDRAGDLVGLALADLVAD